MRTVSTDIARKLRKSSTDVEGRLWFKIRNRQIAGVKFRRQHPIDRYIVDFCAPELRLIIELDGSQHAEQEEADQTRTRQLERLGYRVLRFWNSEITDSCDAVLERIHEAVRDSRT